MSNVTMELDIDEAKKLIQQMTVEDKIKLIRQLQKETWAKRMDRILKNIDQHRKNYKISDHQISQEIKKARGEFYARYH